VLLPRLRLVRAEEAALAALHRLAADEGVPCEPEAVAAFSGVGSRVG
jgi:hypothetical protein